MRLLRLSLDQIEQVIREYDQEAKAIREELLRMCWYMRGGLTYTESFNLTHEDRTIIAKIIEGNLETTKETQMPFF
jgi:hypothetical protein